MLQRRGIAPRRPEREAARARGRDRRGGRPGGEADDRDEHGGPRHRHPARVGDRGARRPPHHRHGAPRVAAHRQPAARPRGPPGRTRARRSSSSPSRTTSCASSRPSGWRTSSAGWASPRARKITAPDGHQGDPRARRRRSRPYNFEIRKNLLEYDEVMDLQRKEVYGLRQSILGATRSASAR